MKVEATALECGCEVELPVEEALLARDLASVREPRGRLLERVEISAAVR